jgi:hypothetical protein
MKNYKRKQKDIFPVFEICSKLSNCPTSNFVLDKAKLGSFPLGLPPVVAPQGILGNPPRALA